MNIEELLIKNKQLEDEITALKEKLKKYTAPSRSKTYYENHKEEIQKCFACSTISSFKPNFECKRPYLNIVRSILRMQGYIFEGKDIELKLENHLFKRTMIYTIFRNI